MKEPSGRSIMIKHYDLRKLFVISIFSHLPLSCLKLAIMKLQPLLMTYLQGLIIIIIFAQNLILLFQLYALFIMVKILYSITVSLSGIWYRITLNILKTLDIFKNKIRQWKLINCPCCLCKHIYIYIYVV